MSSLLAVVPWAPWALLLLAMAVSISQVLPRGPGLLFVLIPIWLLAVVGVRAIARRLGARSKRAVVDAVLVGACVLLAPFGGWWVLPAAVAFLVLDAAGIPSSLGPGASGTRLEPILAGATVLTALALTIWLPNMAFYSYSSGSVGSDGVVTESHGTSGLPIATGLVYFMVPAALVGWGAFLDWQRPGAGRRLIGVVGVGLSVASFLGGFSIGGFLVPLAVLTLATFLVAPRGSVG